jgi:hypothetical protein
MQVTLSPTPGSQSDGKLVLHPMSQPYDLEGAAKGVPECLHLQRTGYSKMLQLLLSVLRLYLVPSQH